MTLPANHCARCRAPIVDPAASRACEFHEKQGRFDPFCRNCQPLTEDQIRIEKLERDLIVSRERHRRAAVSCQREYDRAEKAEAERNELHENLVKLSAAVIEAHPEFLIDSALALALTEE